MRGERRDRIDEERELGELGGLVAENERARLLLSFVLSPSYLELRRKLGMGVR